MITEDILALKNKLLDPKRGDKYVTWFYLEGWRLCEIHIGNKQGTVKPVVKGKARIYSRPALKRELESTYWYAARNKATPRNEAGFIVGKRPKKWKHLFA